MRIFAILRQGLSGISSIPRDSGLYRQTFTQPKSIVATVSTRRHFTDLPRRNRVVAEAEWTITPEEWREEKMLVESVRRGIWAGTNGGMLHNSQAIEGQVVN